MRFKKIVGILCMMGLVLTSGCSNVESEETAQFSSDSQEEKTGSAETQSAQKEVFAMDTYMTVTAYGEQAEAATDAAIEEIERLDALLSTGDENSEIAQANRNGGGRLSEDSVYLLEKAAELYDETEGAFDITIYPIMEAWGFTTQDYQVPSEEILQELLVLTDGAQIEFDEETMEISFGMEGMQIDFGGIAKGYCHRSVRWELMILR